MLDKYVSGMVVRMSQEAPVPIVPVEKEYDVCGGAANTANNLSQLGAKVTLMGVAGSDHNYGMLTNLLTTKKIDNRIIVEPYRKTTTKMRVLNHHQQICRIDSEDKHDITPYTHQAILRTINSELKNYDAVILSDYDKGCLTSDLVKKIVEFSRLRSVPVFVDPKPDKAPKYCGVTAMTPNRGEIEGIIQTMKVKDISELVTVFGCDILVTKGEYGMTLYDTDGAVINIPTFAKEVYDVSGAGDTVIAAYALSIVSGASKKNAAIIANQAAGIVVGKLGTATTTVEEIKKNYHEQSQNITTNKNTQ